MARRPHGAARANRQWLRRLGDRRRPHHRIRPSGRRPAVFDRRLAAARRTAALLPRRSPRSPPTRTRRSTTPSTATGAIPFFGLRILMITPNIRCGIARRAAWRLRLADTPEHGFAWLFGVYGFQLREGLSDTSAGLYEDPFDPTQNSQSLQVVQSQYHALNSALYGQLDGDLGPRLAGRSACAASGAPPITTTRRRTSMRRPPATRSIRKTISGAATPRSTTPSRPASRSMRCSRAATRRAAST